MFNNVRWVSQRNELGYFKEIILFIENNYLIIIPQNKIHSRSTI